jgi:hypothetical protein
VTARSGVTRQVIAIGSDGVARLALDSGGPVGEDLAYRINLSGNRADVDDSADRALAVEHRGGPAQDLDPLRRPGVEREGEARTPSRRR